MALPDLTRLVALATDANPRDRLEFASLTRGEVRELLTHLNSLTGASAAASCCGIREGETLAEFIRRLYEETTADDD